MVGSLVDFVSFFIAIITLLECVECLNSLSTPLCFNCFISPIVLFSTSSNQLFSGAFITTYVQIFHRFKCVYFLMILYRLPPRTLGAVVTPQV